MNIRLLVFLQSDPLAKSAHNKLLRIESGMDTSFDTSFQSSCRPFRPCFHQEDCWDSEDPNGTTAATWILFSIMISVGSVLILIAETATRFERLYVPFYTLREWISSRSARSEVQNILDLESPPPPDPSLAFVSTHRSEENFCRDLGDPRVLLPCNYCAEYDPSFRNQIIYPVSGFLFLNVSQVFSVALCPVLLGCLGWAFLSSAFSSILYLAVHYDERCSSSTNGQHEISLWVDNVGSAFSHILSDYGFFPIFLLVGYIGYVVGRWRAWMVNAHHMQGRLNDVAMLCGACVEAHHVRRTVRQRLYKIYRYLTLLHALCYKAASPTLVDLELEKEFVNKLGLLTEKEAHLLRQAKNKARESALTWLNAEVLQLLQLDDVKSEYVGLELTNAIRGLRATCAEHHGKLRRKPTLRGADLLIALTMILFYR